MTAAFVDEEVDLYDPSAPFDCEVCQDQGEVSNGPAPYDTDECPACTRVK